MSRRLSVVLLWAATCLAAPGGAAADVVLEWNEIAQRTVAPVNPLLQSRSMAIVQVAVADAVGAVGGGYAPLVSRPPAAPGASAPAAAVAAAHTALVALHAAAAPSLAAAQAASLAAIADGPARAEGIRVGKAAAAAVLAARAADGWNGTATYAPANRPGRWVPTPPGLAPALMPHWARVKPFVLTRADQFRAAPPPAVDSDAYAHDLREVLELGGAGSTRRTAQVTSAARFWIVSGMQGWNPAARQASAPKGQSLARNARLLALLNVAMADALIACWDSKYTYDTWRPVTVIRTGGAGVAADAGWTPLIPTPPFPAYPSGHACAAGAAEAVLDRLLGPSGHAIALTGATAEGVTFTYESFQAIADQVDEARVCGGIHLRHDQTAGRQLGRRVAEHVCRTALRPVGAPAGECGP